MRYDTLTRAIESNYLARPPMAFAESHIAGVCWGGCFGGKVDQPSFTEITTRRTSQPMTHSREVEDLSNDFGNRHRHICRISS